MKLLLKLGNADEKTVRALSFQQLVIAGCLARTGRQHLNLSERRKDWWLAPSLSAQRSRKIWCTRGMAKATLNGLSVCMDTGIDTKVACVCATQDALEILDCMRPILVDSADGC